jgi:hypothetical protein
MGRRVARKKVEKVKRGRIVAVRNPKTIEVLELERTPLLPLSSAGSYSAAQNRQAHEDEENADQRSSNWLRTPPANHVLISS